MNILIFLIMTLATIIGMIKILRWAFKTMHDLAAIGFGLIVLFVVSNILVTIAFGPLWLALGVSSLIILGMMVSSLYKTKER